MENGGTAVGIRCKDGVVLAVEKIISSKLLKPGANKRIATVDRNIGVVGLFIEKSGDLAPQKDVDYPFYRFLRDLYQMVDTSYHEHETRHRPGGRLTRVPYLSQHSPADSGATSRHTRFIQVYDHSV